MDIVSLAGSIEAPEASSISLWVLIVLGLCSGLWALFRKERP